MKVRYRLSALVTKEEAIYMGGTTEQIAKDRLKAKLREAVDYLVDNSIVTSHMDEHNTARIYTLDIGINKKEDARDDYNHGRTGWFR